MQAETVVSRARIYVNVLFGRSKSWEREFGGEASA
jgi:hypothetical protein